VRRVDGQNLELWQGDRRIAELRSGSAPLRLDLLLQRRALRFSTHRPAAAAHDFESGHSSRVPHAEFSGIGRTANPYQNCAGPSSPIRHFSMRPQLSPGLGPYLLAIRRCAHISIHELV
jgi:hypothetical protein